MRLTNRSTSVRGALMEVGHTSEEVDYALPVKSTHF